MEKPEIEKAQTALESIVDASDRASDIIVSVGAMFANPSSFLCYLCCADVS
jgi:hypothetical protein